MSNFRNKKINFSQIPNTVLWNKKLSMQAKGLYCEIIYYEIDEDIKLTKGYLINKGIETKEEVEEILNELQNFGYIKIVNDVIHVLIGGISNDTQLWHYSC